ncbi:MAG TPA: hypothetical protein VK506_03075 [Conexibacter sp.]|nr:hypothetical protein [Conexibacter sp.]
MPSQPDHNSTEAFAAPPRGWLRATIVAALAILFVGRSVSGAIPPAWQSGEAMPWPSAAEMREQRVRDAEARRGGGDLTPPDQLTVPDDASELTGPDPATSKRKRKKRR